jgi:hypothetical protein
VILEPRDSKALRGGKSRHSGRYYLKGRAGDATNAILAAVGYKQPATRPRMAPGSAHPPSNGVKPSFLTGRTPKHSVLRARHARRNPVR